jgi:hypothetical protein
MEELMAQAADCKPLVSKVTPSKGPDAGAAYAMVHLGECLDCAKEDLTVGFSFSKGGFWLCNDDGSAKDACVVHESLMALLMNSSLPSRCSDSCHDVAMGDRFMEALASALNAQAE